MRALWLRFSKLSLADCWRIGKWWGRQKITKNINSISIVWHMRGCLWRHRWAHAVRRQHHAIQSNIVMADSLCMHVHFETMSIFVLSLWSMMIGTIVTNYVTHAHSMRYLYACMQSLCSSSIQTHQNGIDCDNKYTNTAKAWAI